MGLFGFFKKKEVVPQPSQPQFEINQLQTDIPPIDGNLPLPPDASMPGLPPEFPQDIPPPINPLTTPESDIPLLPEQLPPLPFDQNAQQDFAPQDFSLPYQDANQAPSQSQNVMFPQGTTNFADALNSSSEIEDDLNKLFLSDNSWKEPDWANFTPYYEEKIEQPTSEDFGVPISQDAQTEDIKMEMPSPLPSFEEPTQETEDITPPEDYSKEKKRTVVPMDLFVRGSDYKAVVDEFNKINTMLGTPEPEINLTEDIIRKQETDLNAAKENMEYVYKRLLSIDKKIFHG